MVLRQDNTAVRLHPHTASEMKPVYGRVEDWLPSAPRPSFHAGAPVTKELCREIPQLDRIPHLEASAALQRFADQSDMAIGDLPRPVDPSFLWWRLLANLGPEAQQRVMAETGVLDLVVERHEGPANLTKFYNGHRFVAVRGGGVRMHIWPRTPCGKVRKTVIVEHWG